MVLSNSGQGLTELFVTGSSGTSPAGAAVTPWWGFATSYLTPYYPVTPTISSLTPTLNRIYLLPITVTAERVFTSFWLNCTLGAAGSLCRLAIYQADALYHPTTAVYDSGQIDASATAVLTRTMSIDLPAGQYYLAFWCNNGTAKYSCTTTNGPGASLGYSLDGSGNAQGIVALYSSATFGTAFPDLTNATLLTYTYGQTLPILGIR